MSWIARRTRRGHFAPQHVAAAPPLNIPTVFPAAGVFRRPAFRLFFAARCLANVAVQAEAVTIGWMVYAIARRTHDVRESAFLVGMVGLVQFLPLFALTLIAGETADRYDRRRVMQLCLATQIACDLGLLALSLHHSTPLGPVFAVASVFGASRAFLQPASSSMGPMLVPREELPRAIAWNSLGFQTGAVLGPWFGGALCAIAPAAAFAAAAGFYALAVVALQLIRVDTRPEPQTGSRWTLVKQGLAYIWRQKIVFGAISLDLFAVLLGGATALLPVFAQDVLHVGANGFGLLRSGPAIGAVGMAIWLARRPIQRRAGWWMFAAVALYGVATVVFAVSRWVAVSVALLAAMGAADMVSVYVRQSLVQIATPDAMRGRVASVSTLFVGASNELGEFETGVAARLVGPIAAALFGGIGSLVVTGAWAGLFPALRRADRLSAPERST